MAEKVLDLILDQPGEMPPAMLAAAEKFKTGLEAGALNLEGALDEILGDPQDLPPDTLPKEATPILTAWADQTPGAPAALAFLVLAAAAPGLKACGAAIAQAGGLDPEPIGSHGACPVCGSLPYILELRGKEGARYAHCSLCRHDYRISRMACPACGTQDPDKLKYFTTDGETGFRVETCDTCRTYVKTIDFRALDRQVFAPLNDLESLALDLLAQDQKYVRLAPSVWRI
jgi:FdhE protein